MIGAISILVPVGLSLAAPIASAFVQYLMVTVFVIHLMTLMFELHDVEIVLHIPSFMEEKTEQLRASETVAEDHRQLLSENNQSEQHDDQASQ